MNWHEIFSYDAATGRLLWRAGKKGRGCVEGREAGTTERGYRCIRLLGKKTYAHRVIWEMFHGPIPEGMQIDHMNGVRSDNRIENMRLVTQQENLKNTRLRDSNTAGVPGITALPGGRFRARIGTGGGSTAYLGAFNTKADAVLARKEAERRFGYHANHGRSK